MITIKRHVRPTRKNDSANTSVEWERRNTRNLRILIDKINNVAIHKINSSAYQQLVDGTVDDASCIWQDLNVISREFALCGMAKHTKTTQCDCSHPIHYVFKVVHKPTGKRFHLGEDCINRIFPTLMRIKLRDMLLDILECFDAKVLPVISPIDLELYTELFYLVDDNACQRLIMASRKEILRNSIGGCTSIFTEKLLRFCGLDAYIHTYNKMLRDHNNALPH